MKQTLIIGASPNPTRYAFKAAQMLTAKGHPIINVGIKTGEVAGATIEQAGEIHSNVHTVTLYIGPVHQDAYYEYILQTSPKRVIFNPGTENEDLEVRLKEQGIETVNACTLVMLATGQY